MSAGPAWKPWLVLLSAGLLGVAVGACGASAGGATEPALDPNGGPIPTTSVAATPQPTTVTTPNGAPKVVQFKAPPRYWCLPAHPGQAQVTVGWSVPSATAAAVILDGRTLHQGLRKQLPFAVLAPKPQGIGVTIVFPCSAQRRHRITIRWSAGGSPTSQRTITINRGAGR